ncbi:hypothetical protein QR680_010795 [Steinernema hermaphroditum]|uniref:UPAR/Ly6 domain-containing protein n=1 Tax=Steinernema hermaphroditum TaxID=289476 RepID=A0AA39IQ51_9BILA|nr:hypothetical protein QR680_010795 [Steinernema hermaphroditum]
MRPLTVLVFLSSLFLSVHSLKCYRGSKDSQQLEQCDKEVTFCYKTKMKVSKIMGYDYGCDVVGFCRANGEVEAKFPDEMKVKFNCCSADRCNGSSKIGMPALLVAVALVVMSVL